MPTSPSFRHIPPKAQCMGEGGGRGFDWMCQNSSPFSSFLVPFNFWLTSLGAAPPFWKKYQQKYNLKSVHCYFYCNGSPTKWCSSMSMKLAQTFLVSTPSGPHWFDQCDETAGQWTPDSRRLLDRDRHLEAGMGTRGGSTIQYQAVRAACLKNCQPAAFDW